MAANDKESRDLCRRLLSQIFGPFSTKVRIGKFQCIGGYRAYRAEKEAAVSEYKKRPNKGPMADKELQNYLDGRVDEEMAILNSDKVQYLLGYLLIVTLQNCNFAKYSTHSGFRRMSVCVFVCVCPTTFLFTA